MPDSPEPRSSSAALPPPLPAVVELAPAAAAEREIVVPRGIAKWSKWRQATLRAEHREARQQLRAGMGKSARPASETEAPAGDHSSDRDPDPRILPA